MIFAFIILIVVTIVTIVGGMYYVYINKCNIKNADENCKCKEGTVLSQKECVECDSFIKGSSYTNGTCACPAMMINDNNKCKPCNMYLPNSIFFNNNCICPPSFELDAANNKCVCPTGTLIIGKSCGVCASSLIYDANSRSCICPPDGTCVNSCNHISNSIPFNNTCICALPRILNKEGTKCLTCPEMLTNSTMDYARNTCVCKNPYVDGTNECVVCNTKMTGSNYDPISSTCKCPYETVENKDSTKCIRCSEKLPNSQYNYVTKECDCESARRVYNSSRTECVTCSPPFTYDIISKTCK